MGETELAVPWSGQHKVALIPSSKTFQRTIILISAAGIDPQKPESFTMIRYLSKIEG
jgi:hypothetical protein